MSSFFCNPPQPSPAEIEQAADDVARASAALSSAWVRHGLGPCRIDDDVAALEMVFQLARYKAALAAPPPPLADAPPPLGLTPEESEELTKILRKMIEERRREDELLGR